MAITVTEALAEIKTIDKRVEKKSEFIGKYLARQEMVRDPLEKNGGSMAAIAAERQSMYDLIARKVLIRRAIQEKNALTMVSINGQTQSVADWLVWRREVAPTIQSHLRHLTQGLTSIRRDAQSKGHAIVGAGEGKPTDIIVNIDEHALAREIEELEEILGALDGQLSLKNATMTIDI